MPTRPLVAKGIAAISSRPDQGDDRPGPHRPRGDPSAAEDEEAADQRQPDGYRGRHGVARQLDRDAADHQERRDPGGWAGSGMPRQAGKSHDRRAQQQRGGDDQCARQESRKHRGSLEG